jgi:hypothetical protein
LRHGPWIEIDEHITFSVETTSSIWPSSLPTKVLHAIDTSSATISGAAP